IVYASCMMRMTVSRAQGRRFIANSGTEANEMAIKLARLHGRPSGRTTILVLEGAFHGRTMGTLSLTPKATYRDPFLPAVPDVVTVQHSLESLEEAFATGGVAAMIIEPIQGEAGVVELPEGFLARARALATAHDALLILDEVQTGSGRTGEWFAFQREGIVP